MVSVGIKWLLLKIQKFFYFCEEGVIFMRTLDLKKNSIENFEKTEEDTVSYDTWEQDLIRSWEFLKMTHTLEGRDVISGLYLHQEHDYEFKKQEWEYYYDLPDNEAVCIRALIDHKKTKRKAGNKELIIKSFDGAGFCQYYDFMRKCLFHRDAEYNFFYNIYKVDYVRGQCFQNATGYRMIGRIENVTSTNLLAVDLDSYSFEEYKEIRKLFLDRDIIPIEVSSGHGFHILVKIETCTDKELLAKWLKVLSDYNINVDKHCKNPGRVYRLPFFYNVKSAKYDTVVKSEIIEGEHGVPSYNVEDIFQKFGYDYAGWNELYMIKTENKKSSDSVSTKAAKTSLPNNNSNCRYQNTCSITDAELANLYPMLDTVALPEGIRSMLKGFVEGYTYYQLMCMVLFFKRSKYSLEQIKDIVSVTESINGNDWNSWDTLETAEGFYHNIYGINMEELEDLETEFGDIIFPAYDCGLKVPLGVMKPNELKLYLYLLRYGGGRKKDITNFLHISANKLDRIMDSAILVKRDGLKYSIMDKKVRKYIYLSEDELDTYLQWDENEIAIYLYLKFRCGDDENIQTSRESIQKGTHMTHTVVTRTIQYMESRKLISVIRKENQHHLVKELRESNIYTLLEEQSS